MVKSWHTESELELHPVVLDLDSVWMNTSTISLWPPKKLTYTTGCMLIDSLVDKPTSYAAHGVTMVGHAAHGVTLVGHAAHSVTLVGHTACGVTLVGHAAHGMTLVCHAAHTMSLW